MQVRGSGRHWCGWSRRCGGTCLASVGLGLLLALTLPLRAVLILTGLAMIVLGLGRLRR